MVASFRSFIIAATLAAVVNAQVFPTFPTGGSETTGQTCVIAWTGDPSSPTTWQGMAVELMSGPNLNMVHLTTVCTGQDGTKAGSCNHTCPEVTINAAIYFYQLSSPIAGPNGAVWTTRFAIAAADGNVVPAPDSTQPPPGNEAIPWGYGALVNTATAVPQPTFAPDTSTDTPDDASGSESSSSGSSGTGAPAGSTPTVSSSPSSTTGSSSSSKLLTSGSAAPTGNVSSINSNSNTTNTNAQSGSGAVGGQVQFIQAVAVLVGCAVGFGVLL